MPRAGYATLFDEPCTQGTTGVRTDVAYGKEFPVDVEYGYDILVGFDGGACAGWEIFGFARNHGIRHSLIQSC